MIDYVAALRNELPEDQNFRYYANVRDGAKGTISYSFMTSVPAGTFTTYGDPRDTFRSFSSFERHQVERAFDIYESVANVHFKAAGNSAADVSFGAYDIGNNIAGYANLPVWDKAAGEQYHAGGFGEVWLDTRYGVSQFDAFLHEIGHTLGLEHPFEGHDRLPESEDKESLTVMSYTFDKPMETLGIYDIMALQSIYGPAKLRTGNDTYKLGEDKLIWDGGGVDKIDASAAKHGVTLDLHDGSRSAIGGFEESLQAKGQVYLGDFTEIENARGSAYADTILGNALDNSITGGTGNDKIKGGGGADVLKGQSGSDVLVGGGGADTLKGGAEADTFRFMDDGDSGVGSGRRDVIKDFEHALDSIDLAKIDANGSDSGRGAFDWIGGSAFTGDGHELRSYQIDFSGTRADRTIIEADIDGNGEVDFQIYLKGIVALDTGDFIL